ncbi:MAG: glycerol dehydrogenase [Roseovarius sp.]|nr:glycerol dehydrogenase [Roseovarius sp.]
MNTQQQDIRIFGALHRYYQGVDALDRLGEVLRPFGRKPLLIIDGPVLDLLGGRIDAICEASGLAPVTRPFAGEITYRAVDDIVVSLGGPESGIAKDMRPGIVAGIGGGKALDAAKAVSVKLGIPVVTVPTIASNDSPTSAVIAMYDEDHVMISVDRMARSPEAVIVDTAIIAGAPVRFLRAGIGDAISKKFEAEGCRDGTGITLFGARPLRTGMAIADCCYATLRTHAAGAIADCEAGRVGADLDATVEAIILMSGLGFENGGLSLAHSLTRGLVKTRGAMNAVHGNQVAWATLVQLAFDGRSDADIRELIGFHRKLGLPASLEDLGMADPASDEIDFIAKWTMTAPHLGNLSQQPTQSSLTEAIRRSEKLAKGFDPS